ncbi:hypothetical protein A3Q56_00169 [Intoshia linei]|uniref:VPS9 domain-containing protein n=1 Tax=Intoshia linei TaxID=1819745 RepID=A0A177BCJ9_9BILA|nr:hypothetical protein A3Q56_00169 [Intoshia linei]
MSLKSESITNIVKHSSIQKNNQDTNLYDILLKLISKDTVNVVMSPVSIQMVMQMIYMAIPDTEREEFDFYKNFKNYQKTMDVIPLVKLKELSIAEKSNFDFNYVGKIYISNEFELKKTYVKSISDTFNMPNAIEHKNFKKVDLLVNEINSFVNEFTKGNIQKVITNTDIQESTVALLVSAIHLNVSYTKAFDESLTKKHNFKSMLTKKNMQVDTMSLKDSLKYYQDTHTDIVQINYRTEGLNLIIVKRYDGQHVDDIDSLLEIFEESGKYEEVNLLLPKFKLHSKLKLNKYLQILKINKIFSKEANVKLMSDKPLLVEKIIHVANLEVNEKGTVASAATIVSIGLMSMPLQSKASKIIKIDSTFSAYIVYKPKDVIKSIVLFISSKSKEENDLLDDDNLLNKIKYLFEELYLNIETRVNKSYQDLFRRETTWEVPCLYCTLNEHISTNTLVDRDVQIQNKLTYFKHIIQKAIFLSKFNMIEYKNSRNTLHQYIYRKFDEARTNATVNTTERDTSIICIYSESIRFVKIANRCCLISFINDLHDNPIFNRGYITYLSSIRQILYMSKYNIKSMRQFIKCEMNCVEVMMINIICENMLLFHSEKFSKLQNFIQSTASTKDMILEIGLTLKSFKTALQTSKIWINAPLTFVSKYLQCLERRLYSECFVKLFYPIFKTYSHSDDKIYEKLTTIAPSFPPDDKLINIDNDMIPGAPWCHVQSIFKEILMYKTPSDMYERCIKFSHSLISASIEQLSNAQHTKIVWSLDHSMPINSYILLNTGLEQFKSIISFITAYSETIKKQKNNENVLFNFKFTDEHLTFEWTNFKSAFNFLNNLDERSTTDEKKTKRRIVPEPPTE